MKYYPELFKYSFNDFVKSELVTRTRAFIYKESSVVVPMLDMLNHKSVNPNSKIGFNSETKSF